MVTRLTAAGHAIAAHPPLDAFPTDDLAADNARMNELLAGRIHTLPEGGAGVY